MARFTENLTANGNSATFSPAKTHTYPLNLFISLEGDFGGGTLKLQSSLDSGSNWQDVRDGSWTAEEGAGFISHPGVDYRFNLSGATGPDFVVTIR